MDLMTWTLLENWPEFGSTVVYQKGPFCNFKNLSERSIPLDSFREIMQF